jgi:hypothetical protein
VNRGAVESREERVLGRQRVGQGRIGVGTQAAADQQARYAASDSTGDPLHFPGLRRWKRQEFRPGPGIPVVDPVQGEGVEVDVQIQGVAEALNESHRAAPGRLDVTPLAGAAPERSEEGADEEAQDRLGEPGVEGEAVPQVERERENPLTDGNMRQD